MKLTRDSVFVPFDATQEEVVELSVHREIDRLLMGELRTWIETAHSMCDDMDDQFLRRATLALRVDFTTVGAYASYAGPWSKMTGRQVLHFVDYVLRMVDVDEDLVHDLKTILEWAHSKYEVHQLEDGTYTLGFLAPPETLKTLDLATDKAGHHLRAAFNHAYAVEPNPSAAYESAMKALEAAAGPVVEPTAKGTRLGKVVSVLRQGGAAIDLPLSTTDNTDMDTPGALRDLLRAMMVGQTDRHSTEDSVPVTLDQARTVVLLATSLVPMFQDGLITNTKPPKGS